MTNLMGSMLISAGLVTYLGPFNYEFRKRILNTWF
jgi:hypothetical protein